MRTRVLAALVMLMLGLLPATSANANVAYPQGCRGNGTANYWSDLCWLGSNGSAYVNQANMVTGVQRQVRYLGFNPGSSNDGFYGSQTASAISSYQQSRGLGADGVAGGSTLSSLQYDRTYCTGGGADPNRWYYAVGASSCIVYSENPYTSPRTIYVRGTANQAWRLFDIDGPFS